MKTYENSYYEEMTEDQLIIKIRRVLDNPIGRHLYELSFNTTDINELKKLLRQGKILFGTYIKDFEHYLDYEEKSNP